MPVSDIVADSEPKNSPFKQEEDVQLVSIALEGLKPLPSGSKCDFSSPAHWKVLPRLPALQVNQVWHKSHIRQELFKRVSSVEVSLYGMISLGRIVLVFSTLVIICGIPLASDARNVTAAVHADISSAASRPVFVWFFGYVGDDFYPQIELGLSPQNMVAAAANISSTVGASNLKFVSAINELPGHVISAKMIPIIKSYVDNLSQYGTVYGRIDLLQFNATTNPSVYSEVAKYVNQMDIRGLWFDHAAIVYGNNPRKFNQMMQNLTDMFPFLVFILNQSTDYKGYIHHFKGTTWANQTYITPTVVVNTYKRVPGNIAQWNSIFPGHVLLHFDAFAKSSHEPMGIFADQNASTEIKAIDSLADAGAYPRYQNQSFALLFPVMGSWTYLYSQYNGTLYNSLPNGTYARGTLVNFTARMVNP